MKKPIGDCSVTSASEALDSGGGRKKKTDIQDYVYEKKNVASGDIEDFCGMMKS